MDQKDLDRAPIKDLRVKSPSYGVRTPQLLMSREAGLFEKGDILDANTTTELVTSAIKEVGNSGDIVALANKVNTVINDDGSINVQGRINVPNNIELVDLGLPSGTLWMTCNIGAEIESDGGLYFQWGDTVGYDRSNAEVHSTWSNCPGNGGASLADESAFTTWDTTNLTNNVLNTSVDPVYDYTNGRAKMPTEAQFEELCNETDSIWATINEVEGRKFISRKDYSTYIFFPALGCFDGTSFSPTITRCYYWSSTRDSDNVDSAYIGDFASDYDAISLGTFGRYCGLPVRGVASSASATKLTLPSSSGTLALTSDIEAETARAKAKEKEFDAAMAEVACVYGVRHYYNNSSSALTRIGASNLHVTLPVQSLMRRCVVADDGSVVYYLDANDSTKKEDGTAAVLDGTDGQVMVEVPEHYRRHTLGSDYYDSEISLVPFTGAFKVNKYYVSMSEAAMDRTNNKLSSVVNTTTQYRGGNNTAGWDNTYRSLLGMPATNMSTINYHTYANNRGTGWEMYEIDVHDDIYWLYVIEYANLNVQLAYNSELTSEGYHQGGLGSGVTVRPSGDWGSYNSFNPVVPCGATLSLGNNSGVVAYTVLASDGTSTAATEQVPSYRGIQNLYAHIQQWTIGYMGVGNGTNQVAYRCRNRKHYSTGSLNSYYSQVGLISWRGDYIKTIIKNKQGDFIPTSVGAGDTTYFSDYLSESHDNSNIFAASVGGSLPAGSLCGLGCLSLSYGFGHVDLSCGSRLVYCSSDYIIEA